MGDDDYFCEIYDLYVERRIIYIYNIFGKNKKS